MITQTKRPSTYDRDLARKSIAIDLCPSSKPTLLRHAMLYVCIRLFISSLDTGLLKPRPLQRDLARKSIVIDLCPSSRTHDAL